MASVRKGQGIVIDALVMLSEVVSNVEGGRASGIGIPKESQGIVDALANIAHAQCGCYRKHQALTMVPGAWSYCRGH